MTDPKEIRFIVAGDKQAEASDFVVCCLAAEDPGYFADNLIGACCECARPVIFRPHAPKTPPKICADCLAAKIELERDA